MKPLHALFLGTLGVSYAYYSRDHRTEIADIIGSHEKRVLLEHLVSGISMPLLGKFAFTEKSYVHELTGTYVLIHVAWELSQYTTRGFYQWDQTIADVTGCVLGLAILAYGQRKKDEIIS